MVRFFGEVDGADGGEKSLVCLNWDGRSGTRDTRIYTVNWVMYPFLKHFIEIHSREK